MTNPLFPELEARRAVNNTPIQLSSLRWVQRALTRMWEDSGYWRGDGYYDKTTGENVFSRLDWHIVAISGNTITVTPTDSSNCRNRTMLSYSYAGEGGNSRIHGSRSGCVAAGDRLQISFPSVWEIGHNAVIRKVEYVGSNSLKLTLDRSTDGIKNSTHPRYKIGNGFEIYKATITDVSYTDGAGATRWTASASWAIDGALVATTSRRCIPVPWFQISLRTKKHGCLFCICDHSNSVANLAPDGVAIDEDGRHWYCARRRYFTEVFSPYLDENDEPTGGGQYSYAWHTPTGLADFTPDCERCGTCDQYVDSFDDGRGDCKDWAYFDEAIHMPRVLDQFWQSVPIYHELYTPQQGDAIFRSHQVGTPSLLSLLRIPGTLNKSIDEYTTQNAPMGFWSNAYLSNGALSIGALNEDKMPHDNGVYDFKYGFTPRIKCFEKCGRGVVDFVKMPPAKYHHKKPKKTLTTREIGDVVLDLSDGTGRIFLKQRRLQITLGGNRYTFDCCGGAGFLLPNNLQPCFGEAQSYGSTWGLVRIYDNMIITGEGLEIKAQIPIGIYAGDGADDPQDWHLVHEYWEVVEGVGQWTINEDQNDVDEPPPVELFSGAKAEEVTGRLCYRDCVMIPTEENRGDVMYELIMAGDTITFERAGL